MVNVAGFILCIFYHDKNRKGTSWNEGKRVATNEFTTSKREKGTTYFETERNPKHRPVGKKETLVGSAGCKHPVCSAQSYVLLQSNSFGYFQMNLGRCFQVYR